MLVINNDNHYYHFSLKKENKDTYSIDTIIKTISTNMAPTDRRRDRE